MYDKNTSIFSMDYEITMGNPRIEAVEWDQMSSFTKNFFGQGRSAFIIPSL